jgi:hypothetical protein
MFSSCDAAKRKVDTLNVKMMKARSENTRISEGAAKFNK